MRSSYLYKRAALDYVLLILLLVLKIRVFSLVGGGGLVGVGWEQSGLGQDKDGFHQFSQMPQVKNFKETISLSGVDAD